MPCQTWAITPDAAVLPVFDTVSECFLTNTAPGAGIVTTPDGVHFHRIRLDNDGDIETDNFIVAGPNDFVWTTALTGPLFVVGSQSDVIGAIYRLRADGSGSFISDQFALTGWQLNRLQYLTGTFTSDVMILGLFNGIVLTTPNGLHTYRVRMDVDGTPISEIVT